MDLLVLFLITSTLSMAIAPGTASETEDRHLLFLCRYFPWLWCCRYGVLGRVCHYTKECRLFLGNTVCSGGRCRCAPGYDQISGKCVQPKTIDDPCTSDQECMATILDGICNPTESQCACVEGKVEYNETTCGEPKTIGDPCTSDQECMATILNGICNPTESQCACVEGKVEYNETTCGEPKTIGDPCTSDQECTATILNGICNPTESQCACIEGKVEYNATTCTGNAVA
ncbi:unnamed protein product [Cyprideis torosa]|uniref:EB domain-containing protein n=1 Tax=Cyprideis torosa TaxID=163714 RepID=A0A7R8WLX5_9CRUS|nr:unnamed protein product [Cyprideis torosa]CAG0904783.1 unnamed protein product [Cyprideis torosa]